MTNTTIWTARTFSIKQATIVGLLKQRPKTQPDLMRSCWQRLRLQHDQAAGVARRGHGSRSPSFSSARVPHGERYLARGCI